MGLKIIPFFANGLLDFAGKSQRTLKMAADTNHSKIRVLRRFKDKIVLCLATILFILCIIPFSLFFILPCLIYRELLLCYAKWCKPSLGKLLCARSSLAAIDDIYTFPKCTLLGVAVVNGDIDVSVLKKDVMRRIVQAKNAKGQLMYPELQQYFCSWGGYLFWKWVKDFEIENHVSVFEKSEREVMGELDLINLRTELISKPYKRGVSPWEFVVVRNYHPKFPLMIDVDNNYDAKQDESNKSPKSVLIMRIHHGVTDGYSLLKLWLNTMQSENMKLDDIPQPVFHKRNLLKSVLYHAWALLCVPYYVTEQLMTTYDNNFFHPRGTTLVRKCSAAGVTLSASIVKEIREKNNVTFTAVLMAALAGGVRNYMLANGIPVPEKMHVTQPLPWPGHPDKLRNFWSFCIINLPLQVADPRERLRLLHGKRESLVRSTVPFLNLKLVSLVGSLPAPFIQWATKRKATTIMMSNFPGPQEPSSMLGYPILDASFGGGFGRGNLAFGISMISYNGTMRLGLGVDKSILPNQPQAQELLNFIRDEIFILGQDVVV